MMITLLRGPHLCWESLAKSDTEKIKLIIYLHVDSTLLSFINQVFSLVKQQKRKKSSLVSGDCKKKCDISTSTGGGPLYGQLLSKWQKDSPFNAITDS